MNNKIKGTYGYSDNGFEDAIDMEKKSWTYGKLTEEEKLRLSDLFDILRNTIDKKLSYERLWSFIQDVYGNFIYNCGYKDGLLDWRDNDSKKKEVVLRTYTTGDSIIQIVEVTSKKPRYSL